MQSDRFNQDELLALSVLSKTPIKSKELGAFMGTKDAETRAIIRGLRLKGVKVCSGAEGFWIWDGKDDSWKHTLNQIKSRIVALYTLYRAMERSPYDEQERWEIQ